MLLTRITSRVRRDDGGFALAAVLGVMLVAALLAVVVLTVSASASAFATSTRANVQSRAAAQSGIDAVRAAMGTGSCTASGPVTAVGSTGTYQASVYSQSGGAWVLGCPTSAGQQVRVVSTGTAAAKGLQGAANGDTTTVSAIFGAGAAFGPSGPAVYSYRMGSTGLSASGTITSYNGSVADVFVRTGDVTCTGASSNLVARLVVANGNASLGNSCTVGGDVFASGGLTITGNATVGGGVVAASLAMTGGTVRGSAWTTGAATMTGGGNTISGNLSAGSLTFSRGGTLTGNGWIRGATTSDWGALVQGNLTTKSLSGNNSAGLVRGTVSVVPAGPGPSPYVPPATPTVPNWLDYAYNPADWPGFAVQTLSGATCGYAQLSAAVAALGGGKGILDARGCTGGVDPGSFQTLTLANDLAIVANKFSFSGSAGFSSSSAVRLWLITPDTVADALPTCPTGGGFSLSGGFTFASTVSTMIYSPCSVDLSSGNTVYGQVWAGQVSTSGAAALRYVPVGLPGVDLSTGTAVSPTVGRTLLSQAVVSG